MEGFKKFASGFADSSIKKFKQQTNDADENAKQKSLIYGELFSFWLALGLK